MTQEIVDPRIIAATAGNAVVLGASKEGGTGWAIAEELRKHHRHITVAARQRDGIEKLARAIEGTAITCDVTSESQVKALAEAAVEAGKGPIDTAILAAGEGVRGDIASIADSDLQHALDLNLLGPIYFVRHMARRMKNGGSIVLMSSIAATNPWPGYFSYGCAKAAVQALVKYAALEFASRGIHVNAVIPGPIQTPTASAILSNPNLRGALFREIPLGRTATTQEVAEATVWFATAARWITGECVHVDGGMHLRRPPHPDELQAALQQGEASDV
jgi:NAD(P)-dependent dehydrogenase (short-subunit alcohol dehydrogenase family)